MPHVESESTGRMALSQGTRVSQAVAPLASGRTVAIEMFSLTGPLIVTIDGPAGTGKSAVARRLADRLDLQFLDTGAMYRAATLIAILEGIPIDDTNLLLERVEASNMHIDWTRETSSVVIFDRAVDDRIRDADVTRLVSPVSAIPRLREYMVTKQRQISTRHPRLVSEGRDQGSVVFPDAQARFYVDADPAERARRRVLQLKATKGIDADFKATLDEINRRDASDKSRSDGPLRVPEGAIVVDTTRLTEAEVVDALASKVMELAAAP